MHNTFVIRYESDRNISSTWKLWTFKLEFCSLTSYNMSKLSFYIFHKYNKTFNDDIGMITISWSWPSLQTSEVSSAFFIFHFRTLTKIVNMGQNEQFIKFDPCSRINNECFWVDYYRRYKKMDNYWLQKQETFSKRKNVVGTKSNRNLISEITKHLLNVGDVLGLL